MPKIKSTKSSKDKKKITGLRKEKTSVSKVSKAKKPSKAKVRVTVSKVKKPRVAKVKKKILSRPVIEEARVYTADLDKRKRKKPSIIKKVESKIKSEPHIAKTSEAIHKTEVIIQEPKEKLKELEVKLPITVKDLSIKLNQKPSTIIKSLMDSGTLANINQALDEQLANKISGKFGFVLKKALSQEELVIKFHQEEQDLSLFSARAPVITFMGHVDHGKTSLLDVIRKSKVMEKEYGGITQHIGAYTVSLPKGKITFLDTPGHEAFTAMRARGAHITDIVVLVVAADDGIMPQTKEAIDHARAAEVPILVAINKIDKAQADIDRVKKQLSELNLTSEDWGGKTITVGVSAKTGEGIDGLLEMILLEAEMLELKANFDKPASGIVIDAKLSRGRGAVATVLVQNGILNVGDILICGQFYGKIKAMFNDLAKKIERAHPSMPVEITGLSGVPLAGEQFYVVSDEKQARQIAYERQENARFGAIQPKVKRVSLEDISSQIKEGKVRELNIILKADVQGSLGALEDALGDFSTSEVQIKFIHKGIGNINASDAVLAFASGAVIIGFHVDVDGSAKEIRRRDNVDIRTYTVIYEAINEVKTALEGLLEPKLKKIFLGNLVVRQVFNLTKRGLIAGCLVQKGKIMRTSQVSVVRNKETIFEGKVSSLKRFKDDIREVEAGLECGLGIGGFTDYQAGDVIEVYEIEKIARKL